MIPLARLQEFGFKSEDRLPRQLRDDAVTLSLPSALEHGLEPVMVEIAHGLVIPLSSANAHNGMIINSDGMVLHVGHAVADDSRSPLQARFIQEVPYDIRVEVCQIMRRAVLADPSLDEIWKPVCAAWVGWFPPKPNGSKAVRVGVFQHSREAWAGLQGLIGQAADGAAAVSVRVVVQREAEFNKGWLGEETLVDEGPARKMACFLRMQRVLRDPVFHPRSTFKLWRELRGANVFKLVVVPPSEGALDDGNAAGIELSA
ncbi:MAG: hypothetical protein HQL17_04880 [Candidatus Omnitrophica bacterium]|nr:hypothetical protein [Candidatus Omnitrophota bacterium]